MLPLVAHDGSVLSGPASWSRAGDATVDMAVLAGASESAIRAEVVVGGRIRVVTSHVFLRPITPGGPDAGPVDAGAPDASAAPTPTSSGCGCRAGGTGPTGIAGVLAFGIVGWCGELRRRKRAACAAQPEGRRRARARALRRSMGMTTRRSDETTVH